MSEEKFLGVTLLTQIIILIIVFVGAYLIFKPVMERDKLRREQMRKEEKERKDAEKAQKPENSESNNEVEQEKEE